MAKTGKVLSAGELAVLRKVQTSHIEAVRIINRFEALLRAVDERPKKPWSDNWGCPHCALDANGLYDCGGCAYQLTRIRPGYCPCTDVMFGKISYKDHDLSDHVHLEARKIHYHPPDWRMKPAYQRGVLRDIRKWARGHIEWARDVLSRPDPGTYRGRNAYVRHTKEET